MGRKTSIIIPIYNGEKYIVETVVSVINQSYRNLEILCIIDGTKDRSKEWIEKLEDPRVILIEQDNHGAAWTRNYGLSLATGEYVWFLDQDDVLMPGCIEAAITEIERTGSVGVAVNGHLIDSNSKIMRRLYRVNKPNLTLRKLRKGNQLFTPSQVVLRREAIVLNGGFDEGAGLADDWDLWIRLVKGGKIGFLDQYLMQYRLHENNQSRNLEKMLRSEMHVVDQKLDSNQKLSKSYSYMRYAGRAANWRALLTAVYCNVSLLINMRLYWTAGNILLTRMKWTNRTGRAV